jgi:putative PIN family toxin of toxin-antitoxin system
VTDAKELLSEELIKQIENCAREQNRKPAEVLEEAVRRYMALRRLEQLAERGEARALARGIREEDVPGLVHEVRQENKLRGR